MDQQALPSIERTAGRRLCGVLSWVGIVSAAVMIAAASFGRAALVTLAAIVFAFVALTVTITFYRQGIHRQRSAGGAPSSAVTALRESSVLTAISYAWGAAAMQGLYLTPVTGLKWQHGWQYALAMALLAAISLMFGRSLSFSSTGHRALTAERHLRWAPWLAAAQACVAGIGLVALVISGKLFSVRADWAANRVFAALAVAILAVSLASISVQRRLLPALHAS